jgi:hypothetical protein
MFLKAAIKELSKKAINMKSRGIAYAVNGLRTVSLSQEMIQNEHSKEEEEES